MKYFDLHSCAGLFGASLVTALASTASGQNQLWARQIGTAAHDEAPAVAPDGSGGVYVCGRTEGALQGTNMGGVDAWLARYDGTGNPTWIRQVGSGSHDDAYAAASDGSGGVYVGGTTAGSLSGANAGGQDAWLARYDGTGNQLWIRQFGTSDSDNIFAATPDGSGGVYVSGHTEGDLHGASAGGVDAWLARYDGAGNQTWCCQLGSGNHDWAWTVTADGNGGLFIAGTTLGDLGGANVGGLDAWLAHYDGMGLQTWIRHVGTPSTDAIITAASDGLDGLYVGGHTTGTLGAGNLGIQDAWLARYDVAGVQVWIRQLGSSNIDSANGAAPDGSGGVYLSGLTRGDLGGMNQGGDDGWVARYDSAGSLTWIQHLGTSAYDGPQAAASDGSGGVFVSGSTSGDLGGPSFGGRDAWLTRYEGGIVVTRHCNPAVVNSTGQPAQLSASGSNLVVANNVTLFANQLPLNANGFFLASQSPGFLANPGGSQGHLCIGGFIGRYVGPGQIGNSGSSGSFSLPIDLTSMPQPTGPIPVQPGQTWYFQAWYRDANPGTTSNLTDALSIAFQ